MVRNMTNRFENWFDHNGMLHLSPKDEDGKIENSDNGLEFTVEHLLLKGRSENIVGKDLWMFMNMERLHYRAPGKYWQRPDSQPENNKASKDNVIALASYSFKHKDRFKFHEDIDLGSWWWSPRELCYFAYLKGHWLGAFNFIMCICMIFTCMKSKEDTSGKQRAFIILECNPDEMIVTRAICNSILDIKYGGYPWTQIKITYFKDYPLDHPNVVLAHELGI